MKTDKLTKQIIDYIKENCEIEDWNTKDSFNVEIEYQDLKGKNFHEKMVSFKELCDELEKKNIKMVETKEDSPVYYDSKYQWFEVEFEFIPSQIFTDDEMKEIDLSAQDVL